jgi:hypothetical protein
MQSDHQYKARFNDVSLRNANIKGQMAMFGASFGSVDADSVKIGGFLLMQTDAQNKASFKKVVLHNAKIERGINMDGASFAEPLEADSLQVDGDLNMRYGANYAKSVHMPLAHVGGNLDLRGATLASLDLSGASIAEDFRLGGGSEKPAVWTQNKRACDRRLCGVRSNPDDLNALNLHNAHVGNLMDATNAWPPQCQLYLDWFTFKHLGGFDGDTGPDMRKRGMEDWWDKKWARLDPDYSPAPYAQLAAALTASGDRDAANEIRYLGRVRERETEKGWSYIWSGALQYVAAFGIGTKTFRVLLWVLGFSLAGAALLRWVPEARIWGTIEGTALVLRRQLVEAVASDRDQTNVNMSIA